MRWLLVLAAACSAKQPLPREVHVPLTPHVVHLDNGLTAILVPDRDAEQAQLLTSVRAGAADDPVPGVAHLAAHLSYVPTTDGLTRWDRLDRVATDIGAMPYPARTTFTERFAPTHLAEVLQLEAQRLSVPCDAATATWLDRQRGQVAGELRATTDAQLQRDMLHALYPDGDPRARTADATADGVAAIPQAQACAFLQRYYVPANATVVVWGAFEPAAFDDAVRAQLGPLAAGTRNPRVDTPSLALGSRVEVTTDVVVPAIAVAYQLPDDPTDRAVMAFALELLAVKTDGQFLPVEDLGVIWYQHADGALAKLATAVERGIVEPKDFESVRTRRASELLQQLDAYATRMLDVATSPDLDAPFTALANLTARGLAQYVVTHLGLVHARVVAMAPAGTHRYPGAFGHGVHELRGASNFVEQPPGAAPIASPTLARARTIHLANGMQAILVPTSAIPMVRFELAFLAGAAEESGEATGAAYLAAGALEEAVARVHPESAWVAGSRASKAEIELTSVILRGPTVDADLLIDHLDAVEVPLLAADQQKRRDDLAKWPKQTSIQQLETIYTATFGAAHPYGRRMRAPSTAVDAATVAAFATRWFQPNNATLVVTGGFDPAAIEPMIHRVFDRWQGSAALAPPVRMQMVPSAFAIEDGPNVQLEVSWPGPLIDDRFEARMVLSHVIASETYASFDYSQLRQGGLYRLSISYDPANAPLQAAQTMGRIVDLSASAEGPSFRMARKQLVRWFLDSGTSADNWAQLVLLAAQNGRDMPWLADLPKRIAAVGFADLPGLIRSELMTGQLVMTMRGPRATVEAAYARFGTRPTWL